MSNPETKAVKKNNEKNRPIDDQMEKRDKLLDKEMILLEEELPNIVIWPERKFTGEEVHSILNRVSRFVDFDKTVSDDGVTPVPNLRGKSVGDFLAEESYVIQTWGAQNAVKFFVERFPNFPKPLLIIVPPAFMNKDADNKILGFGKNFSALQLTGKTIIDDEPEERIYAPGNTVVHPRSS
ncbi:MAG: hypothetical protein HZA94_01500 [Candidatus Vogelbacteria bacterium]|nr:hypothetical protein [Candidatus Vogelbacteria bacterium]